MSFPIKITTIVDGLEIQFDDSRSFLNINSGEIVSVNTEELRAAEDDDPFNHLSDWEQENRKMAIDIVENFEGYIEIPTKHEVNEYETMEDFSLSVSDRNIQIKLLGAIKGKGAFRRFKDEIINLGIEGNWYSFREERFKEIARDWCKDNNIDFTE